MDVRKKVVVAVVSAAAVGVGSFFIVNAASAAHSITASPDNPVYWTCLNSAHQPANGIRVYTGDNSYPGCGAGYQKVWWSQRGPAGADGAPGTNGQDATLTVAATTQLSDREDGGHGNPSIWANDDLTRTVTVTRDHEVSASKCGAGAAQCWHYFGTVTDAGTFRSIDGGMSPHAGQAINGIVQGSINGNTGLEFYASSDKPDASLVPATATGNAISSGNWAKQLFADGTVYTGVAQPSYSYTYSAPNTCEQWVDSSSNGDGTDATAGDITGTNHCG